PPPPPPKHIESVRDDIETLRASLAFFMQERMTLRARVRSLEQHDLVTLESLKITRGRITWSQLRAKYAEQESHDRKTEDGACRADMTERDIKTLRGGAEATEQRAETLQVSLGAARMDVRDLIVSREADRFEMAELQSQA
nr:hypothetical protein [Tanacetum cinerariifolium]